MNGERFLPNSAVPCRETGRGRDTRPDWSRYSNEALPRRGDLPDHLTPIMSKLHCRYEPKNALPRISIAVECNRTDPIEYWLLDTLITHTKDAICMADHRVTMIDWQSWLKRWDAQQTGYLPEREARFTAMLDTIAALLPERFIALDLACGPGAISQRLLARFPHATSVAVDVDPVLLTLGQYALGTYDGRLRWVDADLRDSAWVRSLGVDQADVVLSTTALHWLPASQLVQVYQDLGKLVRPGGLFLNGDHMRFGPQLPTFRTLAHTLYQRTLRESFAQRQGEDWNQWWAALAAEPGMAELFAERSRRFSDTTHDETAPIFDFHIGALRDAGFREIDVIWQRLDDRVLMAVR